MGDAARQVDGYIRKHKQWQDHLTALRAIMLGSGLTEEVKWRVPCYTLDGGNVAVISGLKEYCALSFFKGVLLKDPEHLLDKPGENTQSGRLIRFTKVREICEQEAALKALLREAIAVEKAGLQVKMKTTADFTIPAELQSRFDENPEFKTAFESLTPGRQRGYILYFSGAKQAKTRESRIDKCTQKIMDGRGVDEE